MNQEDLRGETRKKSISSNRAADIFNSVSPSAILTFLIFRFLSKRNCHFSLIEIYYKIYWLIHFHLRIQFLLCSVYNDAFDLFPRLRIKVQVRRFCRSTISLSSFASKGFFFLFFFFTGNRSSRIFLQKQLYCDALFTRYPFAVRS